MWVLVDFEGMCLVRILSEAELGAIGFDIFQHESILMTFQPFVFPLKLDGLL